MVFYVGLWIRRLFGRPKGYGVEKSKGETMDTKVVRCIAEVIGTQGWNYCKYFFLILILVFRIKISIDRIRLPHKAGI